MGEVYRARDTRLERDVAVKVLPERLSSSPEVRQRFEREAKTISQLSHPHICALYDVGNQDGTEYLVMELLEGETLLDRLRKGPLPLDQILRFGIEIADALDKAHRQGIVHRDLKPGNVMLTKSGVKLLDFGLAKVIAPSVPQSGLTALPTVAGGQSLTEAGTILGTFQYMAPEQLEGSDADARTDIFAFGAVLYEMATGRKAFAGKSQASLIAAIIHTEPAPISTIAPMTPATLDRVVRTCLSKDPEDRFQTAHDAKLQLQWISEGGSLAGAPAPAAARHRGRERMAWGVAAAFFLAALLLGVGYVRRAPAPARPIRLRVEISPEQPLGSGAATVLSPDGRRLVYVAGRGANQKLYVRSLDQWAGTPLAGTEGAAYPFFSPDGDWVGFFTNSRLKKVSVSGGTPVALCEVSDGRGGTWSTDGTIVFAPGFITGLFRVSESGGAPVEVVARKKEERSLRWPFMLPGGKAVLFLAQKAGQNYDDASIEAFDFETGKRTLVHSGGTFPSYLPTGHLAFIKGGTLFGAPFDLKLLKVTGTPVPLVEGVRALALAQRGQGDGSAEYSVSRNGTLAYVAGVQVVEKLAIVRANRSGALTALPARLQAYKSPRLSPDGGRLAIVVDEDVWIYDIGRDALSRLTFDKSSFAPVWSPDGRSVAYSSTREAFTSNLYLQNADGSGQARPLIRNDQNKGLGSFSPDGQIVVYSELDSAKGTSWNLWTLRLTAEAKPELFLGTPASEAGPEFSPDGRWIAYSSNESGQFEIYVRPFPGPGGKWQISTGGGGFSRWADGGRELVYRYGDSWYSVSLKTDRDSLQAGKPLELFHGAFAKFPNNSAFDVSRDGKNFILLQPQQGGKQEDTAHIDLILNWSAELERLASGKK